MPRLAYWMFKKPTVPGSGGNNCTGNVLSKEGMNPSLTHSQTDLRLPCLEGSTSPLLRCHPPGAGGVPRSLLLPLRCRWLAEGQQRVSVVGHNEQSAPWAVQETQQKFMIHTGTCPDFSDFLKSEGVSGYYKEFWMTGHFWGTGQRENFSACSIVNVVALIALIRGKGTSRFLATTSENFESC